MQGDSRLLESLWAERLNRLRSNDPTDHAAAEDAVRTLYGVLGRPPPRMIWGDENLVLTRDDAQMAMRGVTEYLMYGVWRNVPDVQNCAAMLGYSAQTGRFRLTTNKPLIFKYRVKRDQSRIRPVWARDLGNMISQFDAPAEVMFEYAIKLGYHDPANLKPLYHAIKQVLASCFAVVLFEDSCVLTERPVTIHLDEMNLLSSIDGPAFQLGDGKPIYAVNGVIIPDPDECQSFDVYWEHQFATLTGRQRIAMIEYMGWEQFFHIARKHRTILVTDPFGELHRINLSGQTIIVLRVTNATPEPDGSFMRYIIPVDPQCRPLPNPADPLGERGQPQPLTPLNAVASTFGYTGGEYKAMIGPQS